ncbi:phage tail protein [Paraburkholderia sediminicola]|uniref:Phage tail protein n=1 Tax=Paraburkholderia rhynchosiae TaxID=487049 RepID=A0ACC7NMU4_9BURK
MTALKTCFAPVVGSVRNLVMSVTTANAAATLTADEIIVETALGGLPFKLSNFNKTINLATTGAGGMDTGTAPVSGYVALYAIYNPTTGTASLLATNATSVVAPNVYGGANMPSGYTASALVSVVPTNSSSQFAICKQRDRSIKISQANVFSTTTNTPTPTNFSLVGTVPPNAIAISGAQQIGSTAAATSSAQLYSDASNVGNDPAIFTSGSSGTATFSFRDVLLASQQTTRYSASTNAGTLSYVIFITGYTF